MLLVGLTVMLVFVGLLREGRERNLGPEQVFQIMPYIVPSLLPFTIPATLLLAVTVVYGRMAGDLEITAAKAAGIHPLRLLMPAFVLGGILSFVSFGLTDRAIPWAIGNIETIATQAIEAIFLGQLKEEQVYKDEWGGYSVNVRDVQDGVLLDPLFVIRDGNHDQITVRAERSTLKVDPQERKLTVSFKNAEVTAPGNASGWLVDYSYEFDLRQKLGQQKPRHLTTAGIQEEILVLEDTQAQRRLQHDQEVAMLLLTGEYEQLNGDWTGTIRHDEKFARLGGLRMETEIHSRYAMAGSCLFFAFLGGPFAVLQARRQFITTFIMCFLPVLLVYYPATFLVTNLAKNGTVAAWWAVWIPNMLMGIAAWIVLRRVIQH